MSVHVTSWAWRQTVTDVGAKLVLLKLADSANDEGICWPAKTTLATETGMSERSITYKLGFLEAQGLLRIEKRYRDNGSQTSNLYHLKGGAESAGGDAGSAREGVQHIAPLGVQPVAPPEPSVEPSGGPGASRPRDVVWDELEAEFGPPTNKQSRQKRNAAVKLVKESLSGLEGEEAVVKEVRARIRRYRALWGADFLTDMALANQWDALGGTTRSNDFVPKSEPVDYGPDLTPELIEENKRRIKELAGGIGMQLTVDGKEIPHDRVVAEQARLANATRKET